MSDPKNIEPIQDVGPDVLARFRYQAEITFPFCLSCALGSEIVAVIPEHLEDIAIELASRWRFIQAKSRDPERPQWKLSDLLQKGGALRSLYRTHQQTQDVNASLEILLEGAPKSDDPIQYLRPGMNHGEPGLVRGIAKHLRITEKEAGQFIQRVTLLSAPAPRPNIRDANIRLLNEQNKELPYAVVSQIYDRAVAEIEGAMRAEPIGSKWPQYVTHPSQTPPKYQQILAAKRMTKDRLSKLVAPIQSPPRYLLRRLIEVSSSPVSVLEQKLRVGGATEEIIERARNLHANAQKRLLDCQAISYLSHDQMLEDLGQRLETHAQTKRALYASVKRPAIEIWNALLDQFTQQPASIDPNNLLNADPMLLLGEVCELAQSCRIDWGVTHED